MTLEPPTLHYDNKLFAQKTPGAGTNLRQTHTGQGGNGVRTGLERNLVAAFAVTQKGRDVVVAWVVVAASSIGA